MTFEGGYLHDLTSRNDSTRAVKTRTFKENARLDFRNTSQLKNRSINCAVKTDSLECHQHLWVWSYSAMIKRRMSSQGSHRNAWKTDNGFCSSSSKSCVLLFFLRKNPFSWSSFWWSRWWCQGKEEENREKNRSSRMELLDVEDGLI